MKSLFHEHPIDPLLRSRIQLLNLSISAFHVLGSIGLLAAITLTVELALYLNLSLGILVAIICTALGTFFALALMTKIITGEEQLVFYHSEIVAMGMTALLLWALHQPIIPFLEIAILGSGIFMAFGRIGCLMVGCCYGQPHRWGVSYQPEHTTESFTPYYYGVRLFPVQAIESLSAFIIVLIGSELILQDKTPGKALVWCVGAYALLRFFLEFLRGDERPYHLGFSEAQWTSLGLMLVLSVAGHFGFLPWYPLQAALTASLVLMMIGITFERNRIGDRQHLLFESNHLLEIAALLKATQLDGGELWLRTTSRGLNISSSMTSDTHETIYHYTFSTTGRPLTKSAAQHLVAFIHQISGYPGLYELIQGNHETYHMLIHEIKL